MQQYQQLLYDKILNWIPQ